MKKAPIAVALVLVFGLFAAAFSLAPAVAQNLTSNTTSNATTTGNVTGNATGTNATTTTNATGGETLSARGSIATLIFDTGETTTISEMQNETTTTAGNETGMTGNMTTGNATGNTTTSMDDNTTMTLRQIMTGDNASRNATDTSNMTSTTNETSTSNETSTAEELEEPYVLSGDWNLDVQEGNVSEFAANFTMVHIDGTMRHTHELSNFVSSESAGIEISRNGTSLVFGTVFGKVDVATDGQPKWTGVDTVILIEGSNVISLSLASEDTDDHFGGQPIYGIVDSMTDENGNELIETTSTAGNVTSGATGNQTGDGLVENLTEGVGNLTSGVEDFFNSTGQ
jgi:hypothetical protein